MSHVIASFLFSGLFALLHVVCFRLRLVKFQTSVFVTLSLLCLVIYVSSIRLFPDLYGASPGREGGLWGANLFVTSVLLYGILCLCYMSQSIVLQYGSPSMTIIDAVCSRKGSGVSFDELKNLFSNESLVLNRLEDLVSHNLAKYEDNRYYLQPKGALVVRFIRAYRRLLGRPLGG